MEDFIQSPYFNQKDIEQLKSIAEKLELDAETSIADEGEPINEIYFIQSGSAKILKLNTTQLFQEDLGTLKAGDIVGKLPFIDGEPQPTTVMTTEKTILYKIDKDKLDNNLIQKLSLYLGTKVSLELRADLNEKIGSIQESGPHHLVERNWGQFLINVFITLPVVNSLLFPLIWKIPELGLEWLFWFGVFFGVSFLLFLFNIKKEDVGLGKLSLQWWEFTLLASAVILVLIWKGSIPSWIHLLSLFAYCAVFEFLNRGVILTSLRKFINSRSGLKEVVFSAIIATLFPFLNIVEPSWIIWLLLTNLILGWIYLERRSLPLVAGIHFLLALIL